MDMDMDMDCFALLATKHNGLACQLANAHCAAAWA
jgi:phosphoribosyl-AMP cyclohydrolase